MRKELGFLEGRCSDAATFRAVPGSINGSWVLHHGLPPRVMSAEPTQVPLVLPSAAPSDRWAAEVQPEPIENEKAQKPSKRWRVHAEVYRRNTGKASTSIKHLRRSPRSSCGQPPMAKLCATMTHGKLSRWFNFVPTIARSNGSSNGRGMERTAIHGSLGRTC